MKLKQKIWKWVVLVGIILAALKIAPMFFHSDSGFEVLRTVKASKGDLIISVTATGEVKPYNRVEIKPPIAGRVEDVLVQEGDMVHQGQIVAWLSSTERAALLDAARSRGAEVFQKWKDSYKAAPLTAPLDGMVIVRAVEPGQTVTTADPIVVISDKLIVEALVDETDLSRIKLGQKTEIVLDAYPNDIILGKVDHISYESKLSNNVNVYEIDVIPDKLPPVFRSGMTANVTFFVSELKDVLLLPSEAIAELPRRIKKTESSEFAVYVLKNNHPTPIPVQTGLSDGRRTEILKGLEEGANVLVVRKKEVQSKGAFSPFPQQRSGGQQKGRS